MCYKNDFLKKGYTLEDLESILDAIPNEIWLKDENGNYKYVNKAFAERMNKDKEDIIGKNDLNFGNKEIGTRFNNNDKEVILRKAPTFQESKISINGEEKWFETYKSQLYKTGKKSKWIMAMARDITLYKSIDEHIKSEIEHDSKNILANLDFCTELYDIKKFKNTDIDYKERINTIIVNLHNTLKCDEISVFLYDKNLKSLDFYLKTGYHLSLEDDFKLKLDTVTKNTFINEDICHNSTYVMSNLGYHTNNGEVITCSLKCKEKLIGIINIYYDYNNKTNTNYIKDDFIKNCCYKLGLLFKNRFLFNKSKDEFEKRIASEYELEMFLNTATDLCAIVDETGKFIKITDKWTSTLGWTENELLKMNILDLVHPDDLDNFTRIHKKSIKKEFGVLNKYRCKNNEYKILEWSWNYVKDSKCTILTAKDKTNQFKLEKEKRLLEDAIALESLKTEFFANISHEFRTPINIILTTIQLISRNLDNCPCLDEKDKLFKYIKSIKQNSYRILRLVNNLIDITRIDGGYYDLKLINCNIVYLIENIVSSVVDYIGTKGRSIIFDTSEEEIITACDPEKIETIMLNLLSNAVKYTEKDGEILVNIDYDKENSNLIVSVKDDGVKIDEEHAKSIFERFTQTDNLLNRKCEGSGIGLSLVKSLVELHDGTIWLNTEFKDGAEFIFTLPIKKVKDKENIDIQSKVLDSKIDKCNIEFSDIYSV